MQSRAPEAAPVPRSRPVQPELPHKSSAIDERYWAPIDRLTQRQLDDALRPWLEQPSIDAILARRERMRAELKSRPK